MTIMIFLITMLVRRFKNRKQAQQVTASTR
jgi:hypothetical protein